MTQEDFRKIFEACKKCMELHPDDDSYDEIHFNKIMAVLQQQIPQDIEKWIEDEVPIWRDKRLFNEIEETAFYLGFGDCAQLLLPELQQLKEENAAWVNNFNAANDVVKSLEREIEQQKETIEELKGKLAAIIDWQYVMTLERNLNAQAAEIESLKKENAEFIELAKGDAYKKNLEIESLKQENERLKKEIEWWEKHCKEL